MRKSFFLTSLLVFLSFAIFNFASAWGFWGFFAGEIISGEAKEVEEARRAGFECDAGRTFSIYLIGSPVGTPISFAIPDGVFSKTRNEVRQGETIIGGYGGEKLITCKRPVKDEEGKEEEVMSFSLTEVSDSYGYGVSGF